MPRLSLATRLELWSALPCEAGAARLADVPDADVLTIATPEAVQRLEAVTVTLTSRTPAAALVAPRGALAFVDLAPDGVTVAGFDVYRVLSVKRTSGRARGVVTVQAVPPLVDWADVGIMRETTSAGLVRFDFGGIYTPAEALAPALAWLTANGYAHWALDPALADYDARPLEIERKTPLEVVRLVE